MMNPNPELLKAHEHVIATLISLELNSSKRMENFPTLGLNYNTGTSSKKKYFLFATLKKFPSSPAAAS